MTDRSNYEVIVGEKLSDRYRSITFSAEFSGRKVGMSIGYEDGYAVDALAMLSDMSEIEVLEEVMGALYDMGDKSVRNTVDLVDMMEADDLTIDPDDE